MRRFPIRYHFKWMAWWLGIIWFLNCSFPFEGNFDNTPQGNYDFFFYELKQSYAYKDYTFDGYTLDQIQELEGRNLNDSWDSLRDALNRVINVRLLDPHVYSVYSPIPSGDVEFDEYYLNKRGKSNFDIDEPIISDNRITWIKTDSKFIRYGIISNVIGYLYVISLVDNLGGIDRLTSTSVFGELVDEMVEKFSSQGVEKIIVDIRSSAGGAAYRGKEIAGRFLSQEKTFMISENLTSPTTYETVYEKVSPVGKGALRGLPLVLLVNTRTCSGGEMLSLMFQQADGYRRTIGTSTYGCTGTIIDKELMNGWIIRITSSRTFTPDHISYFKIGIVPDELVVTGDSDEVLTRAISFLNK